MSKPNVTRVQSATEWTHVVDASEWTLEETNVQENSYKVSYVIPLRRTGSSSSLDDLWHRAYEHYGLWTDAAC